MDEKITLLYVARPLDEEKTMAEVEDEEDIIVALVGPKNYLLTVISTLASMNDDEPFVL